MSEHQPATIRAVEAVRDLVVELGLQPGDSLPGQRELAERLGLSRPVIREAVARLESQGALRIAPGVGVFVAAREDAGERPILADWRFDSQGTIEEVYQYRFAIEGYAIRMAARRVRGPDIAKLNAINGEFRELLEARRFRDAATMDQEFHDRLMHLSGNRLFRNALRDIGNLIFETHAIPLLAEDKLMEAPREHEWIIAAMAKCDPEMASVAMRHHILRVTERVQLDFYAR